MAVAEMKSAKGLGPEEPSHEEELQEKATGLSSAEMQREVMDGINMLAEVFCIYSGRCSLSTHCKPGDRMEKGSIPLCLPHHTVWWVRQVTGRLSTESQKAAEAGNGKRQFSFLNIHHSGRARRARRGGGTQEAPGSPSKMGKRGTEEASLYRRYILEIISRSW